MKKKITNILLILFISFIGINYVDAASFNVSVGTTNITKGGTTKLTISGSDVTGRFNISTSNSSVVSISEDRAWIENNSYSITLSSLNVGSATITVTPSGVSDSSGNAVSLGAKSVKINVSLPREKSKDNTLKSLSVEGFEISPAFNKSVYDYSVTVPEGTKTVTINALVNESHATVSGIGEVSVTEGINNFAIVVKAENGNSQTYNLIVNVIDENPINVTVDKKNYTVVKLRDNFSCTEPFVESEVTINDNKIPSCYNEKIDYTLVGLKSEDGQVESYIYENGKYRKYEEVVGKSLKIIILDDKNEELPGFIRTKSMINGKSYALNETSKDAKTVVVYGLNVETGEKGYYLYDKVNNSFTLYDASIVNNLNKLNRTYLYVIIAFGIALFLSIICIINLNGSKKKLLKNLKNSNIDNIIDDNKDKKIKKKEESEIIYEEDETETFNILEDDNKKKKKVKKSKKERNKNESD